MIVFNTKRQNFGKHEFNAFGGVLTIKYALDEYGLSTQSARDEASTKLQKLVNVNITERRGASSEMVEQFATAPVLAQLESMKTPVMAWIRSNGGRLGQRQINGTKCGDPTTWKIMQDIPGWWSTRTSAKFTMSFTVRGA